MGKASYQGKELNLYMAKLCCINILLSFTLLPLFSCTTSTSGKREVEHKKWAEFNFVKRIDGLLTDGKRVAVIINISSISNDCSSGIAGIKNSKKIISGRLYNTASSLLLNKFSKNQRFYLVDRSQLQKLLREYELSESGIMNSDKRLRLGKILGANFVIDWAFVMSCRGMEVNEISSARLVELETGRVYTVDEFKVMKHFNDTMESWETDRTYLNRREVFLDENKQVYYY